MKTPASVFLALLLLGNSLAPAAATLDDWAGAAWIWDQPAGSESSQSGDPRYVRRVFELPAGVAGGELWITCDNEFHAYVNGVSVGQGSTWQDLQKIAVGPHLISGKNVLAIEGRNHGGPAGLIARLVVKLADGKEVRVGTGKDCKISLSAPVDWVKVGFDDVKWNSAVELGDVSIGPWRLVAGPPGTAAKSSTPTDGSVSAVESKITARLSAEEQQPYFDFPPGFELELVAADPLVINPITMTLDEQGRIYVSESHTYRYGPSGSPVTPFSNPVVRLERSPDGKHWQRTVVADGFDDPVMGIAVRGDKLWVTANNFLYQYDLGPDGKAINRKTLLEDKNKAWNPFGMFVLEWGPDGLLYMSVGNHQVKLHGSDGVLAGRGGGGIIMRMQPDGTHMERLVQGMRVPYSFEFDPFGQLWVLSNGEGNPNRFIRVIEGVDYQCFTRSVDNNWLAGNSPLAPPCFELLRGAHTQLMRYYGATFPAAYRGTLLLCNWGAHGFSGNNRAIFAYHPDDQGAIVSKQPLLSCRDPHFRPSHIALDLDGNLLVADWYGRDDESDVTGRIWRLKYTGADKPVVTHQLSSAAWNKSGYCLDALGSPHDRVREKAIQQLVSQGDNAVDGLSRNAAGATDPIGAASALWALVRIGTPQSYAAIAAGARHPDAKVRRLAVNLLRRYQSPAAAPVAEQLQKDADPAVRVAAALARSKPEKIRAALLDALKNGAAANEFTRYEAAWHLAENASADSFDLLLASNDPNQQLAGLLTVDLACVEEFASEPFALAALGKVLRSPGPLDPQLLLALAQLNWDPAMTAVVAEMAGSDKLPLAVSARAYLLLKQRAGNEANDLAESAGKRLLEAVKSGTVPMDTPQSQIVLLELLAAEGPAPYAVQKVRDLVQSRDGGVREAAHHLARRFGAQAAPVAAGLWPLATAPNTKFDEAVEQLATICRTEAQPDVAKWDKMLSHPDQLLRSEAIRSLRQFKSRPEIVQLLVRRTPDLVQQDPGSGDELAAVLRDLGAEPDLIPKGLPAATEDKAALTSETLATVSGWSGEELKRRGLLGQKVFERSNCVKCHTTATQTTPLAPSLKGSASQKKEYLIESVLFPSLVIKTGFESETIITSDGRSFSGLVKPEGDTFRVLALDRDVRIPKSEVEQRSVQRISIMPEGQEKQLSCREFADLIGYLMTLR